MTFYAAVDRFVDSIGSWVARRRRWSPEHSQVIIKFDDVGDPKLLNRVVTGRIQRIAHPVPHRTEAEIQLDSPFDYLSDVTFRGITTVLVAPRYSGQSLVRLMLGSVIVTVTAATLQDSDGKKQLHSIAIATMKLAKNPVR